MRKIRTREQLLKDLGRMRAKFERVQQCRADLEKIQVKYEKLLESAPDAMLFVNSESRILFVNAQFERLFGYRETEVVGKHLEILIPERFRPVHGGNVANFFSAPKARPMGAGLRIYGLRKDGSEFPADIALSPLQTEDELLATAAVRDITERRRAEDIIERNYHIQRVISSILKISLEPISLADQMDRVLELIFTMPGLALQSKGFIYIVEEDPQVLVLKAPRSVAESDQPPCEKVVMGRCMCSLGESMCSTIFSDCMAEGPAIRYKNGVPHGHYCVPISAGDELLGIINLYVKQGYRRSPEEEEFLKAVANTLAGVIVRQKADLERQRLQEQLAQAEKFSALGRITANVADEIRNPLTAVGGFARRLSRIVQAEQAKEYASSIVSEVNRLETILHDVLIFSGAAGNNLGEHEVDEIIDEALSPLAEKLRDQGIVVRKDLGEAGAVVVEKKRLIEAVKQLLINAVDAMPNGGALSVAAKKSRIKEANYAEISIEDTGEGIPEGKEDMIFEPFFTTKLRPKGTGLGLSIARKVAEEYGGFIRAANKDGAGAVFTLFLPAKAV